MYKFFLDEQDTSYSIYVNPISSAAGKYLSRRPYLFAVVKELAVATTLHGKRVVVEKDMGREIGTTDVVPTSDDDTIYYALVSKSDVFMRFAKNRDPLASSILTVIFEQDEKGDYEVSDTWIGSCRPPFPGEASETKKSKKFWQTHAFVHDSQAIQTKSVTKVCPF